MKKTTYKTLLASIVLIASSQQIQAQESTKTVCSHAGNTRIIEVVYPKAENRPVCEVVYTNKSGSKVLWNAQNDASYCEQKAMEFTAKQESWGWVCELEETSQEKIEEFEDEIEQKVDDEGLEDKAQAEQEETEAQIDETSQEAQKNETEQSLEEEKEDIDAEVKKLKQEQEKEER